MSDNKREYALLEDLREIYNNKDNYKTMSQIINVVEDIGKKYNCMCITDKEVSKQLTELEKKVKEELLSLEKNKPKIKGGKKTKHFRSKFKKTRRKYKGGEPDAVGYMMIFGALLLIIATFIVAWNEPTPLQRAIAERNFRMTQDASARTEAASSDAAYRGMMPIKPEECSICGVQMSEGDHMTAPCGHKFHRRCINQWKNSGRSMSNTCPLCRAPM